jgi:hypothetical protein
MCEVWYAHFDSKTKAWRHEAWFIVRYTLCEKLLMAQDALNPYRCGLSTAVYERPSLSRGQ